MDYKQKIEEKRQKFVDTLIDFIENNPTQWQAGWYSVPNETPWNGKTQKKYNGLNALYLCVLSMIKGYKDPRWVTFNQAKELGANVKSGEKSSEVFYWSKYDKKTKQPFDNKTCDGMTYEEAREYMDENVRPVIKFYQVFNAEQCDNIPEYEITTVTPEMEADERKRQNALAEQIISNSAAAISYDGGNRAYYSPSADSIHLPEIKDFKTMQDYYATALHEIAHSTGHESRLNRNIKGMFGTPDYAKEELRAELASVFMQVEYGISVEGKHFENHGAYLASWLKSVKDNKNEFFSAASDAEKITSYIAENYLHEQERQERKDNAEEAAPVFEANTSFAKQVDAVLSGADATSTHLKVMGTPLILRQLGARNIPVLMTAKHLRNIVADGGRDISVNYHGLNADLVKKLPELLSDPVFVMDSLTRDDSVVVVTSAIDKENRPIIGAIKFDGYGNLNDVEIDANILTSTYGKDNFKNFIKLNMDKNTILYWDKEKSQELLKTPGFQLPDNLNSLTTNTIIRQSKVFVNTSNSENEKKVEIVDKNTANRGLKEFEAKTTQDRIDELQHNFMSESNDEETQEWRNLLTPIEEQIVAEWDKSYLKGTTELSRDIILTDKRQEKAAEENKPVSPFYGMYMRTQEENPNAIILQRIGDFYEVMGANATVAAETLELTLTGRDVGLGDRVPMCGFPFHAADRYISKLRERSDVVVRDNDGEKVLKKTLQQVEQAHQAEQTSQSLTAQIAELSYESSNTNRLMRQISYDNLAKIAERNGIDYAALKLDVKWDMDIDTAEMELQALKKTPSEAKSWIENYHSNFNQRTGDVAIWYYEGRLKDMAEKDHSAEQEAIEKAREEAHSAGLPFSDKYYDNEENFDPNVYDGSMSVEDYNLMHSLMEAGEQKKATAPEQGKKPIVINFYAGPGAGKTTAAFELTAALKKAGINVEYVSEYAKDLVLEGKTELLSNQQHVTDEQFHRLDRLRNNVDVIVTDSPVLLGIVYGAERIDDAYRQQLRSYYDSFNNIDLHIERRKEYQTNGRIETEQQAKVLDTAISKMLQQQNISSRAFADNELQETVQLVKQAQQAELANFIKKGLNEIKWLNGETEGFSEEEIPDIVNDLKSWFENSRYNELISGGQSFDNGYDLYIEETLTPYLSMLSNKAEQTAGYTANVKIDGISWTERKNGNLMSTATFTWQDAKLYASEKEAMAQSEIIAKRLSNENAIPFVSSISLRENINEEPVQQAQQAKPAEPVQQVEPVEPVEQVGQVQQAKWNNIPLDTALIGAERGKSTQLKMPDGEYSSFVFFAPTKFIRQDEKSGTVQLSVNDIFKYTLMKGNQRVELTGSELRQAMAGKEIGKRAQRVLSAENAQTLSDIYRNVPQEMREYPNWCVFTTRWNEEKGKKDKQIFSPVLGLNKDGRMQWASIDKPETWATFDIAMKYAEENDCAGLVFALDGKSGISCIDLDKAIVKNGKLNDKPTKRAEGEMSELAARLSEELHDTYIETSASGNGIHIFVKLLAKGKYKNRVETPDGEIEVYDDRRFMSMTGNIRSKTLRLGKSPVATTAWLQGKLGEKIAVNQNAPPPRQSRQIDSSDSAVIERIRRSKKGTEFDSLYRGENVTGDNSRTDFKLLNMLAFFTDCDSGQMERIFRDSALYRPDKGEAYVKRSVSKACETLQTRMSDRGFFGGGNNKGGGRGNSK